MKRGSSNLAGVFWRSLLLQAAWNVETRQGLGLAWAVLPALGRIHGPGSQAFFKALERYQATFNTHPYLSGPLIGAIIRQEEEAAQGHLETAGVDALKASLASSFAAIGDGLFWNGLRPLAALAGLFLAFMDSLWGPALFLAVYSAGHFSVRWLGMRAGYSLGNRLILRLGDLRPTRLITWVRWGLASLAALATLGAGLAIAAEFVEPPWVKILAVGAGPLVFGVYRLVREGYRVEYIVYALFLFFATLSLIFSWLGL